MKYNVVSVLIFVLAISCQSKKEETSPDHKFSSQRIISIAANFILKRNIPGAAISISMDNQMVYNKGFGFTTFSKESPIQPATVFPIASVTKMVTATGILKLEEEGKLSIDHSISQYFPELPKAYSSITIKNLLNHTSGLDLLTDLADSLKQYHDIDIRNDKIFEYLTEEEIKSEPNQIWAYNNTPGYFLLSLLIERVSQISYSEFLEKYISTPLGLENFGLCSSEPLKSNYTLSFFIDHPVAKFLDNSKIFEQLAGQGGICSSAEDLLTFLMALQSGKLISKSNFEKMKLKTTLTNGLEIPYGLGMRMGYSGEHFKIGHTGGAFTDFAVALHYPEENISIVVLTNAEPSNAPLLAERIASEIFNLETPKKIALNKKTYEGNFQWGSNQITYTLDEHETLWELIDYGEDGLDSLDYYYVGNNRFYNQQYGAEIEFLMENDTAISITSFSSGLFSDSEIAVRRR